MTEPGSERKLHRALGFWGAFGTAVGLVVAGSTMVSLGNGFGLGGQAFLVAAFAAGIISILIAFSYAELANMLPGAGMISDYTAPALGHLFAIFGVIGGYGVLVGAVSNVEALVAGTALNRVWSFVPVLPIAVALPTILVVINLLGVEAFGKAQIFLTTIMIGTLAVFGIIGLLGLGGGTRREAILFNPAGWGDITQLMALGIYLYVGIEYVCPMSEEIRRPGRNIARAMILGIVVIFVADMLYGWATLFYVPHQELANSSIPHLLGAEGIAGRAGLIAITIATVFASMSSMDANLAAVPRMLYGMAREGLVPSIFGYIHPRFRTPWVGILTIFALIIIPLFTYSQSNIITTLILIATVTWLASYILAQIDVIVLRRKYPGATRPFRTPMYPVPQIIGIAACMWMIYGIHPDPEVKVRIWFYSGVIALIILTYGVIWLKFVKGWALFKPVPLDEEMEIIRQRSEAEEEELNETART